MLDAKDLNFQEINEKVREEIESGNKRVVLDNVNGHRYIGAGLKGAVNIEINGVAGNDLGSFMDGPNIDVNDNAQDAIGNTMNSGQIVVNGNAGDLVGHSMRGGEIYIRGDAGARIGIHMKAYKDLFPVIVVGGSVQDFLGEYMAGGLLIVLGLECDSSEVVGDYIGTGMHGGKIFIRGEVKNFQLGSEVGMKRLTDSDKSILNEYLEKYFNQFDKRFEVDFEEFVKLVPESTRPYDNVYTY